MKNLKTKIRESLIKISGYYLLKEYALPVGCDLIIDLRLKIKSPINTIFDVGANVGQTAIWLNDYMKNANIYSFEPVKKTYLKLLDNTCNIDQIKSFNIAFGEKEEAMDIKLFSEESSTLNSLKETSQNIDSNFIETIQVVTGDFFCKQNHINHIDLLKIDTEVFEIEVLKGFSEMLKNGQIKAIYCEVGFDPENNRNTYINNIFNFMTANNYKFYGLYEINNMPIKRSLNYGNALFINDKFL
jgi:FkbM family methyltransferase